MSVVKRILYILAGLLMIAFGIVLLLEPHYGIYFIVGVVGIIFVVFGIRYLIYYFTMAKHMVGGHLILFIGLLVTLLGLFALTLNSVPQKSLMTLLVVMVFFFAIVSILRALEAKKGGAGWKIKFAEGLIEAIVAIACIVFGRILTDSMSISFAIVCFLFAIDTIIHAIHGQNWKALMKAFTPTAKEDIQ